jgi:hypothetical protein
MRAVHRLQHQQTVHLIRRNILARKHFGLAEKIAQNLGVAPSARPVEIVVGFHFFRQHADIHGQVGLC